MSTLAALVDDHFGFLVQEFGFLRQPIEKPAQEHVLYSKGPLLLNFWWGKGEIEIFFEVAFDFSKDHSVFRPYISRTFTLAELAIRRDASAFLRFQEVAKADPTIRGPIMTSKHASLYLDVTAEAMLAHCRDVLEGDLTPLEVITMERRGRA